MLLKAKPRRGLWGLRIKVNEMTKEKEKKKRPGLKPGRYKGWKVGD